MKKKNALDLHRKNFTRENLRAFIRETSTLLNLNGKSYLLRICVLNLLSER